MEKIVIEKLDNGLPDPNFALKGDGGFDCYSREDIELKPNQRMNIPLGIKIQLPEDHVALVLAKSGLSSKTGLDAITGLIDNGYRGEVNMISHNISDETITIHRGQKVCQIMVLKLPKTFIEYGMVEENTERGENGFGSTGI